jgi:hypothetical protein
MSAAIVVIMMSRNRIKHACTIASAGARPSLSDSSKVNHHDRILLLRPTRRMIPTNIHAQIDLEDQQSQKRAKTANSSPDRIVIG